ncbi:hypothetical protein [Radiobacillus deserti]|nr:hypothetical protein [Radiobacillus deserti]
MDNKQAVQLAKQIIELDLLRDEIWEQYACIAGDMAYELLRAVQNS